MDLEYFMTEDYDLYRDYENLMLQLPEDSITTYGAIAKALGDIKVAKAVGFMLSRNTDGDKIKCYKVIHSDGRVGKFTHPLGSEERIRRLEKDGAIIKNGSVSNFKEKCYDAFRTDYPLKHLSDLQTQLFQDFSEKLNSDLYDLSEYNEIGAVDVSYYNQKGYGVFVYTSGEKICDILPQLTQGLPVSKTEVAIGRAPISTGVNLGVPLPTAINPAFRMFIAAFRSRSMVRPHGLHWYMRSDSFRSFLMLQESMRVPRISLSTVLS